jgi:chromosome partitioning protein
VRTVVVSFINYKGGVGKTTLAVETAAALASWGGVHVLLCDLDPQTNATFYLMDPEQWADWAQRRGTLRDLFNPVVEGRGIPDVSPFLYTWRHGGVAIDLLPSHIDLMPIDIRLAAKFGPENVQAIDVLRTAFKALAGRYEVIICDCPPNLGLVTQNALVASDGYVIVTMPEYLSSLGIATITGAVLALGRRVHEAVANYGGSFAPPALRGIIFNRVKYLNRGTVNQDAIMAAVRRGPYGDKVFAAYVSESDKIAQRPQFNVPLVLSQAGVDQAYRQQIEGVAREFIEKVL